MIDDAVGKYLSLPHCSLSDHMVERTRREAFAEPVPLRLREPMGKLVCMNREPTSLYA